MSSTEEALRAQIKALEAERDFFRNLLRSAGDIIVGTDPESPIIQGNEVAEQFFRVSRAGLPGRNAPEVYVDKRARDRLLDPLRAAPEGVIREDVLVRTKKGERKWLGLTLSWLRAADGSPAGTIGVGKGVAERRKLEE